MVSSSSPQRSELRLVPRGLRLHHLLEVRNVRGRLQQMLRQLLPGPGHHAREACCGQHVRAVSIPPPSCQCPLALPCPCRRRRPLLRAPQSAAAARTHAAVQRILAVRQRRVGGARGGLRGALQLQLRAALRKLGLQRDGVRRVDRVTSRRSRRHRRRRCRCCMSTAAFLIQRGTALRELRHRCSAARRGGIALRSERHRARVRLLELGRHPVARRPRLGLERTQRGAAVASVGGGGALEARGNGAHPLLRLALARRRSVRLRTQPRTLRAQFINSAACVCGFRRRARRGIVQRLLLRRRQRQRRRRSGGAILQRGVLTQGVLEARPQVRLAGGQIREGLMQVRVLLAQIAHLPRALLQRALVLRAQLLDVLQQGLGVERTAAGGGGVGGSHCARAELRLQLLIALQRRGQLLPPLDRHVLGGRDVRGQSLYELLSLGGQAVLQHR
ncbi:hypothetical protein JKP88DRAFT_252274 [Tribonema minus]|uniref:Uncharacterized protein n=1 Tax=Tribonema minus TaxID=303371 RepID=A0A836CL94_9STRA|nr:hypothetical protein JKP88DRAFT_252274 [Tribonema minus]